VIFGARFRQANWTILDIVDQGGYAARNGLKIADRIHALDGVEMKTLTEQAKSIETQLDIIRNMRPLTITFEIHVPLRNPAGVNEALDLAAITHVRWQRQRERYGRDFFRELEEVRRPKVRCHRIPLNRVATLGYKGYVFYHVKQA
jgi:predicted metalloprotease with PDZ domain